LVPRQSFRAIGDHELIAVLHSRPEGQIVKTLIFCVTLIAQNKPLFFSLCVIDLTFGQ
jgi:hypothetical protein